MSSNFVKMSRRLKELRVGYQDKSGGGGESLSHDALSSLLDKRGVKVSRDSLINYERNPSIEPTSRHGTCPGMSAKNLVALADLYGVSTDYILGLTDIKTTDVDIATACVTTGLTESAVEKLGAIYRGRGGDDVAALRRAAALNELILSPELDLLLDMIVSYVSARGRVDEQQWRYGVTPEPTANEAAERHADLCMFRATKHLMNFMQRIGDTNAQVQKQRLAEKKGGKTNAE